MGKEDIDRLLGESKKSLESKYGAMRDELKADLDKLKRKALGRG